VLGKGSSRVNSDMATMEGQQSHKRAFSPSYDDNDDDETSAKRLRTTEPEVKTEPIDDDEPGRATTPTLSIDLGYLDRAISVTDLHRVRYYLKVFFLFFVANFISLSFQCPQSSHQAAPGLSRVIGRVKLSAERHPHHRLCPHRRHRLALEHPSLCTILRLSRSRQRRLVV
jgi:hypothetical protein